MNIKDSVIFKKFIRNSVWGMLLISFAIVIVFLIEEGTYLLHEHKTIWGFIIIFCVPITLGAVITIIDIL